LLTPELLPQVQEDVLFHIVRDLAARLAADP